MSSSYKLAKIYTRTGDQGLTSLFTGKRVLKASPIFELLGSVDTLSSSMGVAGIYADKSINKQLRYIQSRLQDLNAHIATPREEKTPEKILKRTSFTYDNVELLENWIDEMDKGLQPLTKFILPGGNLGSAHLQVCRSFCRTAERRCVELFEIDENYDDAAKKYLNRLSDYLFTAARYDTALVKGEDLECIALNNLDCAAENNSN
eukprot:NODE_55_length_26219_cov_0.194908.p12 type:complete len:205 gc:universal NODE_55_length_26219_cov_0.194908:6404-5790(-)